MNSKLILIALAFLSIILALRVGLFLANIKPYSEGQVLTFQTTLENQPKITVRGAQVTLNLPNSQRVIVFLSLDPSLNYGDKIKIEGRIKYFKASNGTKALPAGRQVASMSYPRIVLAEKGTDSSLILKVRENIISFFNSKLNQTDSALMLGIVFGIKEQMDSRFYANLQKSGLLHVIAASGMNIAMVGGFFVAFFTLFLKRQLALIVSIFGILLYALLAGLEPSIVRAAIMGTLVLSAQLLGRQNSAFLGLFGAGFVMLFLNPPLIYDIGFQLSFMATFGLIYLRPVFTHNSRLRRLIEKSLIGEDLVTTITAQVITLPILFINFGSYSLVSILVNAVVLWTVPILMIIGGASALLGLIFPPLGGLVSYLALPFLSYFEAVVNWFGSSSSQFTVHSLPFSIMIGYYLLLFALIVYARKRS